MHTHHHDREMRGSHPHPRHCGRHGFRGHRFGQDGDFDRDEDRGDRRRMFDSRELRLLLLKLIADQPRHGYELIRAIEELSGGRYAPSPGVVYPALAMLQDLDHIKEAASEGARKAFEATPEGVADLAANAERIEALLARLAALATMRGRMDAGPVHRAMENLRSVLRNRLIGGEATKDQLHDIAAIIDDAAQRIERL
jgi:DNA-binding PadR family transcriptional regulator